MNRPRALVVDDEPDIRELIEITLERMDVASTLVANLGDAYTAAKKTPFSLCLTDMRLPDGNGIDLIRHMHQHHPGVPVAMITAHGNMTSAIEALKAGAFDFVSKPVDLQVLRNLVGTALKLGEAIAAARGSDVDDIHYEVERRGEVPGEHTVLLSSATEQLSLSHAVTTRQVFADGAIRAARWVLDQEPGLYSMQDVLENDL